jgi:ribosomal-protein-alanine N-acetyltransferase
MPANGGDPPPDAFRSEGSSTAPGMPDSTMPTPAGRPFGHHLGMAEVCLREWRAEDALVIAPMLSDPHLLKWSSMNEMGVDRWIAEQRVGRRGPSLAICETGDDQPLGKIALRMPSSASPATSCAAIRVSDQPVGELSYWVLPEARGRGVASAAVGVMLGRARQSGGVRSVVLDIEVDNIASLRVAQRLGADRRQPERVEVDRQGVARTMVVFVIPIS